VALSLFAVLYEGSGKLPGLSVGELERIGEADQQCKGWQPVSGLDLPDGALDDSSTLGELGLIQLGGQAQ
jgi:hypothetical protein